MLYFALVIDWFSVFINAFWIGGLALLLAGFSYHYWVAGATGQTIRAQLSTSSFLKIFWLSFSLVAVGLAGSSRSWWETAVWTIFALYTLYNLFTLIKTN